MNQAKAMSSAELDEVYTQLCTTLTDIGEKQAPLFLARFAMLAIQHMAHANVAQQLIAAAAQDMQTPKEKQPRGVSL